MKRYVDETAVAAKADQIYRALCDVARWPDWDDELERVTIAGAAATGAPFTLRPKGGPNVRMKIVAAEPARLFVDCALLPLARIRTTHELLPHAGGTLVRSIVDVTGPLGFLWDRLVARKLANSAHAQTLRLGAHAASRPN
ncbi:MAG TPA: SRPBCC family protein [Dongiaceae bacterium]